VKTPKEFLFERHQAAEPKLDAVRRKALAKLERSRNRLSWAEWCAGMRWHVAGLGAVWLVVLFFQLDARPGPAVFVAQDKIPPARTLVADLLENRRELMEMTGGEVNSVEENAPAPAVLPPRSEIRSFVEVV
jgi:hypothetical protein